MKTYSNPRMSAVIENWPFGQYRTTATFTIEQKEGQERAVRTTIDPKTGRTSAPKKLTYARKMRIVDGDNGKTYIIYLSAYGHIGVMQSNMKFQEETIYTTDERYPALLALFQEEGNTP